MSEPDPRLGWPREWLAFELLRRRADYRAAWKDYLLELRRRRPEGAGHHGAPQPAVVAAAEKPGPDLLSQPWAARFGLQHMLDPDRDAAAHGHIPWRPAQGPVPVDLVRGPESLVFDPVANPRHGRGFRRFVALRFDLGRPVEAQLDEARALLRGAQGEAVAASRRRGPESIVKALEVLDLDAAGWTNARIGEHRRPGNFDPADLGSQLVKAARRLSEHYLAVAGGLAIPGEG
jgi:hypothetical protein